MGLFRKKDKNVNKDNVIESIDPKEMVSNDKNSEMEILEFSDNDIKKEIKKINSKENRLLFGIIILLIVFVFFLPTITSFVSSNSMFTYNRVVEDIVNTNTVDGMLEIGKDEGSITAKNIQFYNPSKKSNSEIQIVYLPDTTIKNLDGLNIYIELYNSNKSIIYRTPFIVSSLDRKVQGTYRLQVNSKIYTEASYAKITIIDEDEFIKSNNTLICTNNFEDGNYKVQEKVIYNFSDKGLLTYEVSKMMIQILLMINILNYMKKKQMI